MKTSFLVWGHSPIASIYVHGPPEHQSSVHGSCPTTSMFGNMIMFDNMMHGNMIGAGSPKRSRLPDSLSVSSK